MNAVFLTNRSSDTYDSWRIKLERSGLRIDEPTPGRLYVRGEGRDHVWIFQESNPAQVPSSFRERLSDEASSWPIVIEYYSLEFLRKILEIIDDIDDVIVDNDHGTVLPLSEYVDRMKADPDWDWRRPTA